MTTPDTTSVPSRDLTRDERRYVRRLLAMERRLIVIGLVAISLVFIPTVALFYLVVTERRWGMAWFPAFLTAVAVPAVVYFWRRIRPIPLDGRVRAVTGEFRSDERPAGDTSVTVHYLGTYVVSLPEHWLRHLRQHQELKAEVYEVPQGGFDARYYGTTDRGIVLSIDQKFSIEREIPLGLLDLPAYPRWANITWLALVFAMLTLPWSIICRDEIVWSLRYWVSGVRQYDSVSAFLRDLPPRATHVEIAHACLLNASPASRERAYYVVDLERQERDGLAKLAQVERERFRTVDSRERELELFGPHPSVMRYLERAARDRGPATDIARRLDELFRQHRAGVVRVEWSPSSDSSYPRLLPPVPAFDQAETSHYLRATRSTIQRYPALDDSFLDTLGPIQGWSGFYVGIRGDGGAKTPVISLGDVTTGIRLSWLILLGLIPNGLGLAWFIFKAIRDRRIRARIARSYG